jgi:hypothetical protein
MNFDIIVNGKKVGTAEISVNIPKNLINRHVVTETQILECLKTGEPQKWYCMGDIEIRKSN